MIEGWLCPRCGHVWAPFVRECTCAPLNRSARTSLGLLFDGHPIVMPMCLKCGIAAEWHEPNTRCSGKEPNQ